jgi:hypothetical protein
LVSFLLGLLTLAKQRSKSTMLVDGMGIVLKLMEENFPFSAQLLSSYSLVKDELKSTRFFLLLFFYLINLLLNPFVM